MNMEHNQFDRRKFIKKTTLAASVTGGLLTLLQSTSAYSPTSPEDINIIGPKDGFSPQIGTLVSIMN